jgi:hypothetical protein
MATWQERHAWRREFKGLGIRQVREREARSVWHEEKQQVARRWLRAQELRPYFVGAAIGALVSLAGIIANAFVGAWLK